ncbi:MAG: cytochrome C [Acidobacteria bacterium]|nr:MAG: cytochrome C [Acidobacteriota bacterium]
MAQIFHRSTNVISKVSILFLLVSVAGGVALIMAWERSPYATNEGVVYEQPVPFSHDHHTAALGIDCRYCHTTVETSAFAGIPPTETCMTCHKEIWADSPMLEPVRASFRDEVPLRWNRVHDLPDFAYFNHSIHVAKGVGCNTCHGPVNKMPLLYRGASLQMRWCLDCHRHPEKYVRPPEEVFNMDYQPPAGDPQLGERLVAEAGIEGPQRLTSCSTCHR